MEVHLIARNGSAEQNMVFFDDNKALWEKIYDMIDKSYESEYMDFLTSRITHKFDQTYDKFTKKEQIIESTTKDGDPDVYNPQQKENISRGLNSFKSMLNSMKDKYGDTWDDDDREIEKMMKHIDNSVFYRKYY